MNLAGLKAPENFEVSECVGHFYEDSGSWFWHCVTCDTGSGKRRTHLRGHKREGDAAVALKYHRNAKRMQRQQKLYRAWWWREVMTTADPELFAALWLAHHWEIAQGEVCDVMASVQSDNHLWNYAAKLNKDLEPR